MSLFVHVQNGLIHGLFVKLLCLALWGELQRNLNTTVLCLLTCCVVISCEVWEIPAARVFRKSNSQSRRLHIPSDGNDVIAVSL